MMQKAPKLGGAFPGKENFRNFSSFSGGDIVATLGNIVFGELQAVTYQVQREVGPIYTMGSPDPRAYAKGKRGIAGMLVWTTFDRHALLDALIKAMKREGGVESFDIFTAVANLRSTEDEIIDPLMGPRTWADSYGGEIDTLDDLYRVMAAKNLLYIDQVPPFDITLTMANEYGLTTSMAIRGVQMWSEASGMSIDDLVIEQQCGFIAQTIEPLGLRQGKVGREEQEGL